mmetsp:Transcript_2420/g.3021  ORF Transcript_2420/g.3021 Transcript_2420/m.3021 type:complete len:131 (+) Transcript_2420:1642-2034(+)
MANKCDNFTVSMVPYKASNAQTFFSESLKINTVGVSKKFAILTNYTPLLRNAKEGQVKMEQKKYEFVLSTSLSLTNYHDNIYTKMIHIVPRYVLVNHMKSPLEISQVGCKHTYVTLESGMRKEWCWLDHT